MVEAGFFEDRIVWERLANIAGDVRTPENPLGAPMVSSEGACAAYWGYARYRGADAGGEEAAVKSTELRS